MRARMYEMNLIYVSVKTFLFLGVGGYYVCWTKFLVSSRETQHTSVFAQTKMERRAQIFSAIFPRKKVDLIAAYFNEIVKSKYSRVK